MKRKFLTILPLSAALLLATSCSKDDTNTNDIANSGQEITENVVKTITVKGKISNLSISKITTSDEANFSFEGGEIFDIVGDVISGSIAINDAQGNYTASINYTDEDALLSGSFNAVLGSANATSEASSLAAAVQAACYEIPFSVTKSEETYSLKTGDNSDILVYVKSAFIKALYTTTVKLNNSNLDVENGKFYVVPVGQKMGDGNNETVAGKVYTINVQTVTWNMSGDDNLSSGTTIDGITVTFNGGSFGTWISVDNSSLTFATTTGKISKIEINISGEGMIDIKNPDGSSMIGDGPSTETWDFTPAASVTKSINGKLDIYGVTSIVFTIVP